MDTIKGRVNHFFDNWTTFYSLETAIGNLNAKKNAPYYDRLGGKAFRDNVIFIAEKLTNRKVST